MDATALERDAVQFARLAVQRDHEGRYSEAVFYYKEAAQALIYAEMAGSSLERIQEKIIQSKSADPLKSKHQLDLERAHFLVTQAFDEDEKGNVEDAIELYTEAVDLCLKTSSETADKTLQNKLKQLARQALDRTTSKINGIEYVPFMSVDLRERFAYPMPFCDRWGKLPLSPKQKTTFSKWVRPEDLTNNPTMIYTVSSFSIKQTIVSDCSFVASLAISAAYERRFNKKLITSIIYPQNKDGEPEYNPCGKYMVKLHLNGVPRKVIIDDQLPVDHKGELLCSYSNNKSELWVSLIEKAYMKVMGGYDFPGSNSNIDLHALTGWIPERIAMHSDSQTFSKDNSFRMLYQRQGLRFIQLKNPWSHLRWKGSSWDAKQGPVKDAYSLANNPQYKLEVQCPQGGAAVWVLLSRHITDKDDFANNREFITMVVYKTDGKKVYYPADPPPYIDGIRINSPHYLTKIKLTTPGTHTFTLVVSQYEKQNTIHYTVRVYSACSFTFSKIPSPYTLSKRQCYLISNTRQYSVGFEVVAVSITGDPGPHGFQRKSSGDYRCGFCYLELENIPAGIFNIIPSTFLPKQEGPFFLDFNSTVPIKTTQLQ
ncbi:hypothetical protein U0070_012389 [Myodes glareolus]|uniref:Calpain catalytic domain-containing protein n=1 Tax=Myodes glareolus TaxID=447135 RepID=A0AAW0IZ39_MYOGA